MANNLPWLVRDVLGPLLSRRGLASRIRQQRLLEGWEEIVGEAVSQHCWPIRIMDDELIVGVDSSVWMAQLSYYTERIVEQFNQKRGTQLRNVRFRLDKKRPAESISGEAFCSRSLSRAEVKWVDTLCRRIGDPALREALRRILLSHKRHTGGKGGTNARSGD